MAVNLGLTDPAFRYLAISSSLLLLKFSALNLSISSTRGATNTYITAEDGFWPSMHRKIRGTRGGVKKPVTEASEERKRARAEKNRELISRLNACLAHDATNTPLLLITAALYVLACAPSAQESGRLFAMIVVGRFAHTVSYLWGVQPWRFLSHLVAVGAGIEMAVRVLVAVW
ncbi:hypothetical protein HDU98_008363 [Podochytrium sp. JEL0797]|nr:hypothetical protein HDU98_008363 [Podochytrium sp. JEL0797]